MRSFLKPALFSLFGLFCLVLNTDAQPPVPPVPAAPVAPPAPPVPGTTARTLVVQGTPTAAAFYPAGQQGHEVLMTRAYGGDGQTFSYSLFDPADGEAKKIAKQLSEAKTETDKDKLKDKLKELLTKQFDDRQKRHEKELEALETQVKKLKDMVGKRQENKKDIIDERTKQLGREAAGLGW